MWRKWWDQQNRVLSLSYYNVRKWHLYTCLTVYFHFEDRANFCRVLPVLCFSVKALPDNQISKESKQTLYSDSIWNLHFKHTVWHFCLIKTNVAFMCSWDGPISGVGNSFFQLWCVHLSRVWMREQHERQKEVVFLFYHSEHLKKTLWQLFPVFEWLWNTWF